LITKIISKVNVHLFFYFFTCLSIITGHFKDFILFTIIILFHELGHIITGIYFKWNIEKILVLPFGAITIFNTNINKPFKEELIVSIMGFIFQFILYFVLKPLNINNLSVLNYSIFLFNILPIYPLDGSKILNCILNLIFPFKLSNKILIIISFIFLLSFFLLKNLIFYFIILFLLLKIIDQIKKRNFIFIKFLLERKDKKNKYKKIKTIKKINKMYKYYENIFYLNRMYHTEKEILNKKFDFYM